MKEKLKVGIAGYGVVGKRRRQYVDMHPDLKTISVSDISFQNDGVMADGVNYFSDFKKLLDQKLDILLVCLPNYLVPEATIGGLECGMHVFCEKPPGCTVSDIQNVMAAEKKYPKLRLKYGFNHRYHDSVIEAKQIIDSGEYGRILNFRGIYGKSSIIPFSTGWRSERKLAGGGILLDQGIHMLDMLLYFGGDFPDVKSFITNDFWSHDVEDNAYAIMQNKDGCVAMIHSTATQWQHRFRLEIALENALLELSGILSGSKSYGQEQLKIIYRKEESAVGSFDEKITSYLDDHSWKDEIFEFADIVINNKTVSSGTSLDALKVMKLVYRIYYSDISWRNKFNIENPDE